MDCFVRAVTISIPGQDSIVAATSKRNPFAETFLALIKGKDDQVELADTPTISEF